MKNNKKLKVYIVWTAQMNGMTFLSSKYGWLYATFNTLSQAKQFLRNHHIRTEVIIRKGEITFNP